MINTKEENKLKLRSIEVQEILTNPPRWIVRWGITLIFFFSVIILVLSFLIRYPDFIGSKIIVTTELPTEKVVARYTGGIQKLFVANGDTVRSGQPLAYLKNLATFEDVMTLKSTLENTPFDYKNFRFPIESITHLQLGDVEASYISFEKSYVDYILLNDLDPYSNQLKGDQKSIVEIRQRLRDQIALKQLLEKEITLKETEFGRYKSLYDKGVISQQEFESKELEFIQMQKNISNMSISISQLREAISSASEALVNTTISQQEDNVKYSKNLEQSYNTLKKAVRDWEYTYVLTSSIEGTVSFQGFWGKNQLVNVGDVVFSILPEDKSALVGKLTIPSQNAGKVEKGQKTLVKLDNFPYQQYGMLIGVVEGMSISPDNDGNYFVYISLPNGTTTSYNKDLVFEQELLGNAEIITEDLSVAQRLFYKFKDAFDN